MQLFSRSIFHLQLFKKTEELSSYEGQSVTDKRQIRHNNFEIILFIRTILETIEKRLANDKSPKNVRFQQNRRRSKRKI